MFKKASLVASILISTSFIFAQNWEQKASAPGDGRHHPVTFALDGKGYMVTGSTDFVTGTTDFYQYDPVQDEWTTLQDFPGVGRGFSIGDTWNGKAYIGFGFGANNDYLNDLWEYDPSTGNWTELTSCPCAERVHPSFVIEDGLLFVGMGNNDIDGNMNDWWEYNIATDSWRQLPDLPGQERHHPFMFSANGDVYTGFGHGNAPGVNVYNDWYKWDIQNETWTQMNDLPAEGRVAGTQFSFGDRGFVLSGDGDDHYTMQTGEFWEYDYQTDTWTSLPPHPGVSRWAPGSFVINGTVYFMAGEVRSGNANAGLKTDLWSFNLDNTSDIESFEDNDLLVFPNPTSHSLTIEGFNPSEPLTYQIVDLSGKILIEEESADGLIDVTSLSKGIYYISFYKQNGLVSKHKFTKQ